ncbi:hypothetical protein FSP39_008451 [Pinctada imbricata]|uniref:B box-type domain-containing protein n=1 Tax=Pinctada imbricata TaxID=66713 RepID=A0AA88XW18_PINIB|nr:hypothetical protein FSP39_008451 [Pinctada imbricata]
MSISENFVHAQSAVPCNACDDDAPGEYYCVECKQTLCPQCEKFHRKFTKGHNIVLRTQIGDIDTTTLTCTDHHNAATFHCEKCNVPVCDRCVTGKHQGHKMVDLTSILDKETKKLQSDVIKMKREVLPKMKKKRDDISTEKENYEKKIQRITDEMEDEKRTLDRIHATRMKNLASIRESKLSTFDVYLKDTDKAIQNVEETMSEYEDAISKNSLPFIINFIRRKKDLPDLGSRVDLPDAPVYVSGDLHYVVKHLGKLQISEPLSITYPLRLNTAKVVSIIKCPVQGYPSMCITKEGEVWLGGSDSRELVMVNIHGEELRRRKIQNRPYALAAMDCGDIIISPRPDDSRSITRLMKDGREQLVFDTSPSWSRGVSVTKDQKILICIEDGRLMRTTSDGTKVKKIYKGSGCDSVEHAVQISNGNIIISNWKHASVVMINMKGEVLSTITRTAEGQMLGRLHGILVDNMDNIFCAGESKSSVYCIDQNQQIRKFIVLSDVFWKPRCLDVDCDKNLWITQFDGNIHVVKYLSQ